MAKAVEVYNAIGAVHTRQSPARPLAGSPVYDSAASAWTETARPEESIIYLDEAATSWPKAPGVVEAVARAEGRATHAYHRKRTHTLRVPRTLGAPLSSSRRGADHPHLRGHPCLERSLVRARASIEVRA